MSTLLRLFTLFTIAAAGFALPMTCALDTSAAEPTTIEIAASPHLDTTAGAPADLTGADTAQTLTQHLFDKLPLDCGNGATPRATEHPATFDTQPFVPGYLVSTIALVQDSSDVFAPPPQLIAIESRAGPPDVPPPKSID